MSGHSKWSSIKHKKAKEDARRGKIFTRLTREIMIAAREKGGDINNNARLRQVVELAKEANMPQENILRAIKKGTGELPGQTLERSTYEGYGPNGVAFIVETLSDNKNRTSSEIKHIFSKYGGSLGATGCVSWLFHQKGLINIEKGALSEDELMELAIKVGAEDYEIEEDGCNLITSVSDFSQVKENLTQKEIKISFAHLTMIPERAVKVDGKQAEQILHIMNVLEEYEDVQDVYANFDMPDELIEKMS